MMDVLKQLKVLTTDLCWIPADDAVMLSAGARDSAEEREFSQLESNIQMFAEKCSQCVKEEVQLRLL